MINVVSDVTYNIIWFLSGFRLSKINLDIPEDWFGLSAWTRPDWMLCFSFWFLSCLVSCHSPLCSLFSSFPASWLLARSVFFYLTGESLHCCFTKLRVCFLLIHLLVKRSKDCVSLCVFAACNCHRHSFDCYYDPEVNQRRGSVDIHGHHRGGGVCLNCQVTTTQFSRCLKW